MWRTRTAACAGGGTAARETVRAWRASTPSFAHCQHAAHPPVELALGAREQAGLFFTVVCSVLLHVGLVDCNTHTICQKWMAQLAGRAAQGARA